jgi:hypothetical protein
MRRFKRQRPIQDGDLNSHCAERQLNANRTEQMFRPRTGSANNRICRKPTVRSLDAGDPFAFNDDANGGHAFENGRTSRRGGLRHRPRCLDSIDITAFDFECRGEDVGYIEKWLLVKKFLRGQETCLDSDRTLHLNIRSKGYEISILVRALAERENETALDKTAIAADNIAPVSEDLQTQVSESGFRAIRVMLPQQSSGFAARSGCNGFALEKDDSAGSSAGQMPGDTRAHDSTADDNDVGVLRRQ